MHFVGDLRLDYWFIFEQVNIHNILLLRRTDTNPTEVEKKDSSN